MSLLKGVAVASMSALFAVPNTGPVRRGDGPVAPAALSFSAVTAGVSHTCALTVTGQAYCWGANTEGQLGLATRGGTFPSPMAVAGGLTFVALAAGLHTTCGVVNSYDAYCWGANNYGQIGDGTTTPHPSPTKVIGGKKFKAISMASTVTCGVTRTVVGQIGGQLYCWGSNYSGQAGIGTTQSSLLAPQLVASSLSYNSVSAASDHACGQTTSNQILCWGNNQSGRLGDNSTANHLVPQPIAGSLTYRQVVAGTWHTCGLPTVPPPPPGTAYTSPQGTSAYCWGGNHQGQLGINLPTITELTAPGKVTSPAFITLSAGGQTTCGITALNSLYCWGLNDKGQLGIGTLGNRSSPVAVLSALKFTSVAVGRSHTCGLAQGKLYCWGSNLSGQLGTGNDSDALVPTLVLGQ